MTVMTKRQFSARGYHVYRSGTTKNSPITDAEKRSTASMIEKLKSQWKGKTVGMIGGGMHKSGVVLDAKLAIDGYYLAAVLSVKWFEAGKKPRISDSKIRSIYDLHAYADHLSEQSIAIKKQAKLVDNYYDAL
jgi:hypothetical protein